jgi:hypothetical protein
MINGDSEFNEVFFSDARCPKDNVIGGVNNGWAVAMTLLGYERGDAAATFPSCSASSSTGSTAMARERGLDRRPRHPPAPRPGPQHRRDHEVVGWRTLTGVPLRRPPGSRGRPSSCSGPSTTGACPSSPSTSSAPTPWPVGPGPGVELPDRRPRRPERLGVVGGHVPHRPGRHHLRRVQRDPAQHRRRDGPRTAEGAPTRLNGGADRSSLAVGSRPDRAMSGRRARAVYVRHCMGLQGHEARLCADLADLRGVGSRGDAAEQQPALVAVVFPPTLVARHDIGRRAFSRCRCR